MSRVETDFSPEQRARLSQKGRLLYGKFCGTDGRGICAESFALYHIWRGEGLIARDLLAFLEAKAEALRLHDPEGRLALTQELASRIRGHLEAEDVEPPDPSLRTAILKDRKPKP